MFLGTFVAVLTGKNRIVLPKKFRSQLGKGRQIVLTKGLDDCLWGFAIQDWNNESDKILGLAIEEVKVRRVRRYIFGEAEIVELDRQGRFVIPDGLFRFAQFKKEMALVGIGDRFEIWDRKKWEETKREDMGV